MNEHVTDRLSAYIDDELDAAERAGVEAHVGVCAPCASALMDLRRIVRHAAGLTAQDAPPAHDLWSGIAARIQAPRVVAFEPPARRAPRLVSLSLPQLAAAAALLIAVSGATAWFLRGAAGTEDAAVTPIVLAELEPTPAAGSARLANFADAQFDAAVADLELALAERRNDLHPRTVDILERNLRLIDAAIGQARQALEDDPGNAYLNRHLVESRRRKLDLLRRAAAISDGD